MSAIRFTPKLCRRRFERKRATDNCNQRYAKVCDLQPPESGSMSDRGIYRYLGSGLRELSGSFFNLEFSGILLSIEHNGQFRQELHWVPVEEVWSKSPLHYGWLRGAN